MFARNLNWVACGIVGALGAQLAVAQNCGPGLDNDWTGIDGSPFWSKPDNWLNELDQSVAPQACDHVFFLIQSTTVMDVYNGDFEAKYTQGMPLSGARILSLSVSAAGPLQPDPAGNLKFDMPLAAPDVLLTLGDMTRSSSASSSVNDFKVYVKQGSHFFVGDPWEPFPGATLGSTYGLEWDIDGGSLLVTDRIGCGRMTARNAYITVGYRYDPQPGGYFPIPGANADTGAIDIGLCNTTETVDTPWTLNGVQLRARRVDGLRNLTIGHQESGHNQIWISDRVRVGNLTYRGSWGLVGNPFDGYLNGSFFYVGYNPSLVSTPQGTGLRITSGNSLTMERDPSSFQGAANTGPLMKVESLRVEGSGRITLRDGAEFVVGLVHPIFDDDPDILDIPSTPSVPTTDPYEAVFTGSSNASALRYGRALDPMYSIHEEEDEAERVSLFAVLGRKIHDAEQPVKLVFENGAFIAPELSLSLDPSQQLRLVLHQVHLEIRSRLATLPARAWDTSNVDLHVRRDILSDCGVEESDCPTGNAFLCPAKLEAIASDDGPVWFTDVNEPRCRKYWRSLRVGSSDDQESDDIHIKVVDRYNNFLPDPTGSYCEKEAMYVKGNIIVHRNTPDGKPLRLPDDVKLYYGGAIVDGDTNLPVGNAEFACPSTNVQKMVFTHYGDFNGDCRIDLADRCIWEQYYTWPVSSPPPTPRAYFDYDGDCDVDNDDWQVFNARLNTPGGYIIPAPGCMALQTPIPCMS